MSHGPLAGLKVLDLSRVLAGPWVTQQLADLGADVIKVERPGVGDDTRHWGPPFASQGDAAYFLAANRGKRSVEVDISTPDGQAWVRAQLADTDILVENYKAGGLAKHGLDWASLQGDFPGLVYCSITGFGQTGPYARRPGYDFLIQAMGGLMSITGERDDLPGGGPQKVGVAVADLFTGMYATVGILAALRHRDRTGEGQHLDLALLDCQVAMLANQNMNWLVGGEAPGRMGNAHPNIVPYQVFATADSHLILAVGNNAQLERFCEAAGGDARARVLDDPRFATHASRVEHREAMVAVLEPILRSRTTAEWIAVLEAHSVPCGPVNGIDEVFADPQVQARGLQVDLEGVDGQPLALVANPIRFSATPLAYGRPPPTLGQHNAELGAPAADDG